MPWPAGLGRHRRKGPPVRKLVLQMQVSVDGFVAASNRALQWQLWDWRPECPWDAQLQAEFNAQVTAASSILLSRPMVSQGYIDHWTSVAERHPTSRGLAFAKHVAAVDKVVVTRTDWAASSPRTRVMRGALREMVCELKGTPGGNILCFGGSSFAAALMAEDLVDHLQLYINPTAVGEGTSLFGWAREGARLRLVDAKPYQCGIAVMKYERHAVDLRASRGDAGR
jgi:dihydrofolate reductase